MKSFCNLNALKSLINVPTCFKNLNKPSYIDLILTNEPKFFQHSLFLRLLSVIFIVNSNLIENGFSKTKTKTITYRKYKTCDNEKFSSNVLKYNFDKIDFGNKDTLFNIFNKHVSLQ